MSTAETEPKLDGRRLRTERSRTAIAKAVMDIVRETGMSPTADDVAARANVSRRSVFRLFEQMDDLYAEVIVLTQAEARARLEAPGLLEAPVAERIKVFVERLTSLYEDVAPMRRLAERLRVQHAIIDNRLRQDTRDVSLYIKLIFGRELAGKTRAELETTLGAIELALSWHAWDALRSAQNLSVKKAREVIRTIVGASL